VWVIAEFNIPFIFLYKTIASLKSSVKVALFFVLAFPSRIEKIICILVILTCGICTFERIQYKI